MCLVPYSLRPPILFTGHLKNRHDVGLINSLILDRDMS
jgi:hypothetical protein